MNGDAPTWSRCASAAYVGAEQSAPIGGCPPMAAMTNKITLRDDGRLRNGPLRQPSA